VPISTNDGIPRISVDELLYLITGMNTIKKMLNHEPATQCPELDDPAANAMGLRLPIQMMHVRMHGAPTLMSDVGDQQT